MNFNKQFFSLLFYPLPKYKLTNNFYKSYIFKVNQILFY